MTWSRWPLPTSAPRRLREMITRVMSRIGRPTSMIAGRKAGPIIWSRRQTAITSAATRKPSSMLPPSPRKIRAGRVRFEQRKPTHAPESATASAASTSGPSWAASRATPAAQTRADRSRCPVDVVHQVERVDDPDHPEHGHEEVGDLAREQRPAEPGVPEQHTDGHLGERPEPEGRAGSDRRASPPATSAPRRRRSRSAGSRPPRRRRAPRRRSRQGARPRPGTASARCGPCSRVDDRAGRPVAPARWQPG